LKVLTVVGARPQFIKAAVLSVPLRRVATEVLVHTGQHYDDELSQVFFDRLPLPRPDVMLAVGSGSHGQQTGEMLKRLDPLIAQEQPDWVLVYGDTNSTLAGALAAAKLDVPVAHVEAGLRSYRRAMPEEINRVVTDHLSSRLYCPAPFAARQLAQEGITEGVRVVGDVMDEALPLAGTAPEPWFAGLGIRARGYCLATVHRQENTDDPVRLSNIVSALNQLPLPVVWPMHPRTRAALAKFAIVPGPRITVLDPVGYVESITLTRRAAAVLTDSGGVQREAGWLGVPCYILREETEWLDLVEAGQAVLVGHDPRRIVAAVAEHQAHASAKQPGTGIADAIVRDLVGEDVG